MTNVQKLELFFGLPIREIITEYHWRRKIPMYRLCKQAGVDDGCVRVFVRANGIKVMNRMESEKLIDRKGKNSWWYGRKNTGASNRMKINNPSKDPLVREKIARSLSRIFSKNLLPQEKKFLAICWKWSLPIKAQVPIGPYVVDFLSGQTCIEIDTTAKWGTERRARASIKDLWLNEQGFKVVRINKAWLSDLQKIRQILVANNLIGEK